MKSKAPLWIAVAVLVIAALVALCWWELRPQTIVLDDGTQLTLVGVTYGKHHAFDKTKINGRKLQPSGTLETTNDSLCVWILQKTKPNNWPNYQVLAYDSASTACAGSSSRTFANFAGNGRPNEQVCGFVFEAFPRRDRKIYFRIQQWNQRSGQQTVAKQALSASNPGRRNGWTPWAVEALPDAKQDGDLQATLTRCEFEANAFNSYGNRNKPKKTDPMNDGVYTSFRTEQNGNVVTNWQPVHIETTDATGNRIGNNTWSNRKEQDEQVMIYQWGLWPDEPAWKLRVEMSRLSGFTDAEKWTASGISITPGDINDTYRRDKQKKASAETTIDESHLEVFPMIKISAEQGRNYGDGIEGVVKIHVTPEPEGMRLTVEKITDDQGRPLEFQSWGWGGGDYRFAVKKLGDTKFINLILAYHHSRFFEFTVKPLKK